MIHHYDKDEQVIYCKKTKEQFEITAKEFFKITSLIIFILIGSYQCNAAEIQCPYCENSVDLKIECGVFGDTWICQNPHCGYENYTAVSRCGICGKSRY